MGHAWVLPKPGDILCVSVGWYFADTRTIGHREPGIAVETIRGDGGPATRVVLTDGLLAWVLTCHLEPA